MKNHLRALLVCALLSPATLIRAAEYFADQVVSYTPGADVTSYNQSAAALGKPGGNVGSGTFNPFVPNFATTELVQVGFGGELTLRLSNYVTVNYTPGVREIGVWENVGLTASGGSAKNPAEVFGADGAVVSVSADGTNWFALNSGQPILFTLPGNYYVNATGINNAPPASPVLADFGQPFTGTLADFNGKSFADTIATLGGSGGGTWLDIDEAGLSQVGYVRFSGVTSGQTLEVNGVGINSSLAGALVPEPSTLVLTMALGLLFLGLRRNRKAAAMALGTVVLMIGSHARAQEVTAFSDIQYWVGSGPNRAGLVIDWQDGKNAPSLTIGQAVAWGYQWQNGATPTGLDMLTAIAAADPRLELSTGNNPSFGTYVFGLGYDLNGDGGTFTFNSSPSNESGTASDPADHVAYGFNTNGYWEYLNSTTSGTTLPSSSGWNYASAGAGDRLLTNNTWDAWVFSSYAGNPNFDLLTPAAPLAAATPTPEPSTIVLALAGGVALSLRRRRR